MKQIINSFLIILLIFILGWFIKLNTDEFNEWWQEINDEQNYLEVVFFDVGQGDATWVEFTNGDQMLIDCSKDRKVLKQIGKEMWFYDNTLDYLVITHPDLDHYGGCIDIIKKYKVEHIIYNGVKKTDSNFWRKFNQAYQKENAKYYNITKPKEINIASSSLNFFFPDRNLAKQGNRTKFASTNNTSLVFKLKHGKIDILFSGDGEKKLERYISREYSEKLNSEIYKMGHHGSAGSSNNFFISKIQPNISIASAGKDNSFGHPSPVAIQRLENIGSQIFRTDQDGDISVKIFQD